MKVLDIILTEGATGQAGERVLKSILGHATWSSAQKLAFKESVDLCTDAVEQLILRGVDLKSPQATREAWAAIEPRLKGSPWATDKEFIQEIFTVSKAEAEERVAKKAAELHPTEPKPKEEPKATPEKDADKTKPKQPPKTVWGKIDNIANLAIWGSNGAIVVAAIKDYNDRRAYAEAVMEGRVTQNGKTVVWTPEQAQDYARQAHLALLGSLATAIVIPKAIIPATVGTLKIISALLPGKGNFIMSKIATPMENMIKWEALLAKTMARGLTREQAIAHLAKNGLPGQKLSAAFKTAWASFVSTQFATPLGFGFDIPVGKRVGENGKEETVYQSMSPREILALIAIKTPFWSGLNSFVAELLANSIEKGWNAAMSAAGVTDAEYSSFGTQLKKMGEQPAQTTSGPAQKQAQQPKQSQTQQPAVQAPAQNVTKRPDGVEVINWD